MCVVGVDSAYATEVNPIIIYFIPVKINVYTPTRTVFTNQSLRGGKKSLSGWCVSAFYTTTIILHLLRIVNQSIVVCVEAFYAEDY